MWRGSLHVLIRICIAVQHCSEYTEGDTGIQSIALPFITAMGRRPFVFSQLSPQNPANMVTLRLCSISMCGRVASSGGDVQDIGKSDAKRKRADHTLRSH
jgi:hypothetical protein